MLGAVYASKEDYEVLFNSDAPDPELAPTGSVKSLYLENSYGDLTIESTVVDWIPLSKPEAYYAGGTGDRRVREMVLEALELADDLVDFSEFDVDGDGFIDAIDIIHSGHGAESTGNLNMIWSHKWSVQTWTSEEGIKVSDYHTEPALAGRSGKTITRIGVIAHETGHFLGLPDLYDTNGGEAPAPEHDGERLGASTGRPEPAALLGVVQDLPGLVA